MADKLLGSFVWCELMTTDPAAAQSFYKRVVGWTTTPFGPDGAYTVLNNSSGSGRGGIMKIPAEAKGMPPNWMMYVGTPDVDATAMRLAQLGGRVHKQPSDIPTVGRFAVVADPYGAVFNIFLAPHQVGQVADMARRFPGVNVVIDHIAMIDITAPDNAGFGPLLELEKLPNVYVRTSLHNPSKTRQPPFRDVWPFLRRIYDRFGGKRMIWANFYELLIMKELIPFFTAEDKEWILGRTAHRIYKLGA